MNGRLSFSKLKTKVRPLDLTNAIFLLCPSRRVWLKAHTCPTLVFPQILWCSHTHPQEAKFPSIFYILATTRYNPLSKYGELKKFLKIWRLWCTCSHTKILCILPQQGIAFLGFQLSRVWANSTLFVGCEGSELWRWRDWLLLPRVFTLLRVSPLHLSIFFVVVRRLLLRLLLLLLLLHLLLLCRLVFLLWGWRGVLLGECRGMKLCIQP